jgi:predicted ArsR family transcriptional regulator
LLDHRCDTELRLVNPGGLSRREDDGPSPAERRVLDAFAGAPLSLADLAESLGMQAQSVRKHLRALIALGLVRMDGGAGVTGTTYRRS